MATVAPDFNLSTAITTTALAMFNLSTSALYLRPCISGGTADAVDVILAMRG